MSGADIGRLSGDLYTDCLARMHAVLQPRTYLEIGTLNGETLKLSRSRSVAIDPAFALTIDVPQAMPSLFLFNGTSDDFFRTCDPVAILGGKIDFAFLDGMHLFEFLLRDFINTERHCRRESTIVLHDCVPLDFVMTGRDMARVLSDPNARYPGWWTGDVWKTVDILLEHRPDLDIVALDAPPTGLVAIRNLDPASAVLAREYDDIVEARRALPEERSYRDYVRKLRIRSTAVVEHYRTGEQPGDAAWGAGVGRVSLDKAVPQVLPVDALLRGESTGHATLFERRRVERTGRLSIAAAIEDGRAEQLRGFFGDRGYVSPKMSLARLADVSVDLSLGVCVSSDGAIIKPTDSVARAYGTSYEPRAFLASARRGFKANEWTLVDETVLHCFHRSSGAYGHFLFDCLTTIALCRDAILAGSLKVLVPWYVPDWAIVALCGLGLDRDMHFVFPAGPAIKCRAIVLCTNIDTYNTFLPNPELCAIARRALGVTTGNRWPDAAKGRKLYLSRLHQPNFSARTIENELDVQAAISELGFDIVEPGNMSFPEQVAAFQEASLVAGAHGSAFGNLMFVRPGTRVVDLMPLDWIGFYAMDGSAERWALNVTTAFDLDYSIILCQSRMPAHEPDADLNGPPSRPITTTVDIDLLKRVVASAQSG